MIVEVCANSLQSAINAQRAGADRIELCCELGVGGITPSFGLLKKIKESIDIPVHVLIRPRSGDFTYSEMEFEVMKEDILKSKEMGFEGVVSGVLFSDFTVDIKRTSELLRLADGMTFTFHRAFDWVKDPIAALLQIEELGVNYILTSGGESSASKGLALLKKLHKTTGDCKIMPGGGISGLNINEFIEGGFDAIHLSGSVFHRSLAGAPKVTMNSPDFLREDFIALSDYDRIKSIVKSVK